ncbi:hypothetical protein KFK09_017872 [Dendrobium nobile]|uniref:Uncharacterized protein n=1 Tax=Dendrobium nobile TaxID=94219 RepID=A0A8T3AUC7_DENNO|nr:hypothetical protein KFK09_017870 [Dendrobium nobile]KAI0499664.1 hypothetical protein KFK09_017872 [Dendrobium nobile]
MQNIQLLIAEEISSPKPVKHSPSGKEATQREISLERRRVFYLPDLTEVDRYNTDSVGSGAIPE